MISAAGSNDPDVYIINDAGYKRLFLNPAIFNMYGQLTGGFAAVKSVTATVRDAFPTSGLFRDCQVGSANNNGNVYAVEVTGEDTGTLHHVALTGAQAVAQDANFFLKVFCINDNEFNWYPKSSDYTALSQVPTYTRGTTAPTSTPTTNAGSVMASLSPDNPAAGTVLAGQGVADLAHFRLTNNSSTAVAVNSMTFQKLGIAGDSTFANAYVFTTAGQRLTDAVTPSSGVFNITGGTSTTTIVTVPAYGYVDLSFKSDVKAGTSGQTMGIALASVNGTAVSGLNGNLSTVATAPSDAVSASFAASSSLIPSTSGVTTDPLKDSVVWQDTITVNNKNAYLRSFALRQTNSINNSDVNNFRLFVDGVQVAQVQNLDANGYVTFIPATQATLLTGTRTVKVLADIVGGTSRKLTMSLRASADAQIIDSNYGSGVTATIASSGTFPLTAGDMTINSGSIVVQKDTTSPAGNVVKGANDQVLGRWTFTAYGEPTKVSTLIAGFQHTGSAFVLGTSSLRNARIMVHPVGHPELAQQYGSTTSLLYSATASTSYTTNLTINPGQPMIVSLRADIYDNGDASDLTAASDTITADLYTGASNGQGMVSLVTSNVPSTKNLANQLTVQAGSATISTYANFPNQNITAPRTGAKLGDFVIAGSTSEAINVNTLVLDMTVGAGSLLTNLSNVYLKWNGVPTSVKSTVTATGNNYSVTNTTLPVNGTVHVEVFADVGSVTAGSTATFQPSVEVQGTTAQSATAVQTTSSGTSSTSGSTFAGQVMTVAAGTVASALDAGTPVAANNAANSTVDVAKFNFTATNDSFNITEIQLKTTASSSQAGIQNVILKKADGTIVGTKALSQSGNSQIATFGSLTGLTVPANDANGLTLTAAVQTGTVGVNAATSGLNVALTLDYFKNTNSSGTLATDNTDRVGNAQYLYNALPVITPVVLPTSQLSNITQDIAKFTIVGSGNTVGWQKLLFTVSKTSAPNIASSGMKLLQDGVDISSSTTFNSLHIGAGQTSGWILLTANNSTAEFQVPTSGHTYELQAPITSSVANDSISVQITNPTTANISPTTAALAKFVNGSSGTSASFTWTDRSGKSHSATSIDWENDYLIKSLPFSQGLSR